MSTIKKSDINLNECRELGLFLANQFPLDENFTCASEYWKFLVNRTAEYLGTKNESLNPEGFVRVCKGELK